MSDPCGHEWKRPLAMRLLDGLFGIPHDGLHHHCMREFGHNVNPCHCLHRCSCGSVTMCVGDIAAGAREVYGLKDERDH